jgi:chitinase
MLKNNKFLLASFVLICLFNACKKSTDTPPVLTPTPIVPAGVPIAPPTPFGFYVVGYFPTYRVLADVPDVKFKMCNVVNYAFAKVNAAGTLTSFTNTEANHLISVRDKAKSLGAKVFISISGLEADFKTMGATEAGRTTFIIEAMTLVRNYNLDGIDMDWEFPKTSDGTDVTYTAFMKQLSDSCHRGSKYYLTAAITAGIYSGAIRDAIKAELWTGNYVDWFNIMSYDDFTTDPLFRYKNHTSLAVSNASMNYWVTNRGMPAAKAVLGIAGYGRPSGMTQTGNILTMNQILAQGGNLMTDSAVVNVSGVTFTSYFNGINTVKKKAMLAKQMGNGIMLWEKSQDTHGAFSLLKAVCDTVGRAY